MFMAIYGNRLRLSVEFRQFLCLITISTTTFEFMAFVCEQKDMVFCLFRGYIPSIVRVDDRLPGALHPSTDDLDELELYSEFAPPLEWCFVLDVAMID
jgi:hypothetical protein